MALITADQLLKKLNHKDNANNFREKIISPVAEGKNERWPGGHEGGRKKGDKNVSDFEREVIGATAKIEGATKTAKTFRISKHAAELYKDGKISDITKNGVRTIEKDHLLQSKVDKTVEEIREKASDLVLKALNLIPSRLDTEIKPQILAQIAKDCSTILEKTAPKDKGHDVNRPQIVFYAPQVKEMHEFEAIDVPHELVR